MLDLTLLKIAKHRDQYETLSKIAPHAALDRQTLELLKDFGRYFEKFPTHDVIDINTFAGRFKQWHKTFDDDLMESYLRVIQQLAKEVDEETRGGIVRELFQVDLATRVANICLQYDEGTLDGDVAYAIAQMVDAYKINCGAQKVEWDSTPIEDLLKEDMDESGVRWRLRCLNEHMRPLRGGDFGIIAGRPDKGKTTFIASEATFMAPQLSDDRNVLWLNNEGPSGRIVKRIYQAAIGATMSEMIEASNKGELNDAYIKAVGRLDKIRVVNIHNCHVGLVDTIIENSNPGLIIYDMIDKIRGMSADRTDLGLEAMYDWGRNTAVKYDCIGLATSQISNDGDGEIYPTLGMLKDSKTGKQGACDFQLMIGASNDSNLVGARWLSMPKNKLHKEGKPADPRCEVVFDPQRARYRDVPLVAQTETKVAVNE